MAAGYEVCDDGVGNRITQLPFGIEKLVGRLGDRTQSIPPVLTAPDRRSTGCEPPYVRADEACPLDIVPIPGTPPCHEGDPETLVELVAWGMCICLGSDPSSLT